MNTTLYQDKDVKLSETDGCLYFTVGEKVYRISSLPQEPCLYIETKNGHTIVIHNACTTDELRRVSQTEESIRMITGNEYGIGGVCMLIRKAIELGRKSVYIHYVEGCCFMDCMKEKGAVSPESAIDLTAYGLKNPRMMNTLIHSKHVGVTEDGSFWLMKEVLTVPDITYEVDDGNKELEIEIIMS